MTLNSRPSLDVLVPLVMIENNVTNDISDNVSCEPQKDLLRHFESGDVVIVRLDSQCLPAIVFNITGLVMKFNIDQQLYHVCLLNNEFTEHWIDAIDMVIYSVPMIAEFENEQVTLMWSKANELLEIRNDNDDKNRLEEFKRRFIEVKHQQAPLSTINTSRKSSSSSRRRSHTSNQKVSSQIVSIPLTTCEELHIIESIYRLPQCTYAEAKRTAEDTYMKIICTNNRENVQSSSKGIIPDQWLFSFAIQKIDYLRQYSAIWLPDLEAMVDTMENENELRSLISLMKKSV